MPKMGKKQFDIVYVSDGAGHFLKTAVLSTTQRDALTGIEGMVIFNSTTDQLEEYDGATWEAVGQVIMTTHEADLTTHGMLTGTLTSDQTVTNSTTLVDVTNIEFAIGASETWLFIIALKTNSSAAGDFKGGFSIPSGAAIGATITDGRQTLIRHIIADASTSTFNIAGDANDSAMSIVGFVKNSTTAGTVKFQFAQNTQNASDCIIRAGASIFAKRIA